MQFADEKEVKDAQAKVYMADSDRKDMRYAVKDGTCREFSKAKNVTELAYDCYVQALAGCTGSETRFAGHSLGNQLATTLAKKISDNVLAGTISSKLMPERLALLDPCWGKGEEAWLVKNGSVKYAAGMEKKCSTVMR